MPFNKHFTKLVRKKRRYSVAEQTYCDLLTSQYTASVSNDKSYFSGSVYNLGYLGLGGLLYSFAHWLLQQAIKDGIQTLFFLSRDGYLLKRVYDELKPYYPGAPKSVYLYSSRRACQVALLTTTQDIIQLVKIPYAPTTVRAFFYNRFGIELDKIADGVELLDQQGLASNNQVSMQDEQLLVNVAIGLSEVILANASQEHIEYQSYLKAQKLDQEISAVVDIGYAATMQKSLIQFLNLKQLGGYYFVSFRKASMVHTTQTFVKAWLANFIDKKYCSHMVCQFNLLFEVLFSSCEGSLVCFQDGRPILEPVGLESQPVFQRALEQGVLSFIRDFQKMLPSHLMQANLPEQLAGKVLKNFLDQPHFQDLRLLADLKLTNSFNISASQGIARWLSKKRLNRARVLRFWWHKTPYQKEAVGHFLRDIPLKLARSRDPKV